MASWPGDQGSNVWDCFGHFSFKLSHTIRNNGVTVQQGNTCQTFMKAYIDSQNYKPMVDIHAHLSYTEYVKDPNSSKRDKATQSINYRMATNVNVFLDKKTYL